MAGLVTPGDEGKPVIDSNGDRLGHVSTVKGDVAYVEPAGDLRPTVVIALGWAGEDDAYPLRPTAIETVTDRGIHLRSNL